VIGMSVRLDEKVLWAAFTKAKRVDVALDGSGAAFDIFFTVDRSEAIENIPGIIKNQMTVSRVFDGGPDDYVVFIRGGDHD
jgi:hypothetical protein